MNTHTMSAGGLSALLARRSPEEVADEIVRRVELTRKNREATTPAPKAPAPAPNGRRAHYKFQLLRAAIAAGVDGIALVGPAGTGKTTAARMAADALGRRFEATSFGPTTSKADMFGFLDAHGVYRDTGLVRMARDGGVFLGDELDAGHPGVVVGLNMVTANPFFSTPGGMVEKHRDFVAVFGMNTVGTGANRQYVGRNQLDAASLDRLVVIDWDLDPGLEAEMVGVGGMSSPTFNVAEGGGMSAAAWLQYVWNVRRAVEELGIRHIISPRATQNGARLFAQGVGRRHVKDMVLWKGLDASTRAKVEARL